MTAVDDRADDLRDWYAEEQPPKSLPDAVSVFGRWLHLDDTAPILAVAATVVANLVEGDPVWLLIVGPPSGGKTEIISSCAGLPYMVPAATISEAALLSGTSKRERAKDATGGLLRQIGDFGILLAKDFTSVLSQNRDTAKSAMAALREVYDGQWDRPVGTDGGKVLHWRGKAGFIGGTTPSYDRFGSVVTALGDRFLLLRLPDVDAEAQARAALAQAEHEKRMRAQLAAAMTGLIEGADLARAKLAVDADTAAELVRLASFAARARTSVERDGYTGDLLVIPQAEGPARLVKAMSRMHSALAAIGADADTCRSVVCRIAVDCAPAVRVPVMRQLVDTDQAQRTSDIAEAVGMVTKTAGRVLDDLALIGIATRTKKSGADNSPDLWTASDWLRTHWPQKVGQRYTTRREGEVKEAPNNTDHASTASRTFLSHFEPPTGDGRCNGCGFHTATQGHRDGCNGGDQ